MGLTVTFAWNLLMLKTASGEQFLATIVDKVLFQSAGAANSGTPTRL